MGKSRWAAMAASLSLALVGCSTFSSIPMSIGHLPPLTVEIGKPQMLNPLFRDHAVLQRNQPIHVWGASGPGAEVSVALAGETASATADANGKWDAVLAPLPAGGPYELAVSVNGRSQTASDVMIGDVYLCSGQSNMEWPVIAAMHGGADVAGATNANIRLFTVHRTASPVPIDSFAPDTSWSVASPDTVKSFSAVCYFYGRALQPKVGVPVGLIYSAWGGTTIQTWMSHDALHKMGGFDEGLGLLASYQTAPAEAQRKWRQIKDAWWLAHDPAMTASPSWRDPAYDDAAWDRAGTAGSWKDWGVPALKSFDGVLWMRTTVNLTEAQATGKAEVQIGKPGPAVLSLGAIDQSDTTWVNGTEVGGAEGWDTKRVYEIPDGVLHEGANVIAVGILGGDGMVVPTSQRTLKLADGTTVTLDAWRYRTSASVRQTGATPYAPWLNEMGLTLLYNGMIAPLGPTGLSGILWYQGESNTGEAHKYGPLLSGLIADWRRQFGAATPFLIVQLPGWGATDTAPKESDWADLREQQRLVAQTVPKTGLAVTIDLGSRENLHPVVKQEVGLRLALIAEHMIYGQDVVDSGPTPISATRSGNIVTVRFDHLANGFAIQEASTPIGFQLCDTAGHCGFTDAAADKDAMVLDASHMPDAATVRFCWAASPLCNVYNSAGLPGVPFEMAIAGPVKAVSAAPAGSAKLVLRKPVRRRAR